MNTPKEGLPCPYVGLQPFREEDREFFFGRERDQRIITANLLSSPLTILYGASGVGKTSVLMAGVVPHLGRERPGTPVVVFREWVGADFQRSLARACIDAAWKNGSGQPKPAEDLPLDEILRACVEAARETVLVLFDQFEEYFLYHPKSPDPESFEAQFARAVNREDVDVGFLIALREDSLSKLDRFRERIPNLLSNRLTLKHLDVVGAAEAIRRPLEVWNRNHSPAEAPVSIEDGLVAELIEQVRIGRVSLGQQGGSGASGEEGHFVESSFLQLVLTRLWDEETHSGSRALRLETLSRLGGAKKIVQGHLNDVMAQFDGTGQAVCASFFDRLVTPTGSKVACSQEDLERWAESFAPQVPTVLDALCHSRLLRRVTQSAERPDATSYEIYHDVLAAAMLSWRARYMGEQQRAELQRKADEAEARAREKEQNNRRLIRWRRALAGVASLALMLAVIAWRMGWLARESERRAMATSATSGSFINRDRDPELSTLLALQAVTLAKKASAQAALARAESALRRAINQRLQFSLLHDQKVAAAAFSPVVDQPLLATASGKRLHLWDTQTGQEKKTSKPMEHPGDVNRIAFTADGARLVSGGDDGTVRLWDPLTGEDKTPSQAMPHDPSISALAVSPQGLLATGSMKNGRIVFWDIATATPTGELPFGDQDVVWNPDGTRRDQRWVSSLAFNTDGSRLAVGEVNLGTTSLWDVAPLPEGEAARPALLLNWDRGAEGSSDPERKMLVDSVAFSPDDRLIATGDRFNTANLWDAQTGAHITSLFGHSDIIRKVAFSPDGKRVATASDDTTAKIWDVETGKPLISLAGHSNNVLDAAFSPDGKLLATASRDRTAKLWNVGIHSDAINDAAFSPDGKHVATASGDKTIKIWDVDSLELVATLVGHTDRVLGLAFSPDGKFLTSASFDKTARIWDLSSYHETGQRQYSDVKYGYDKIYHIAYSPDGKWLATAGANHNAVVWDAATDKPALVGSHDKQVMAVAFSPDSKHLASAGEDGILKIWEMPSGKLAASFCSPMNPKKPDRRLPLLDVNFSPDGKQLLMATGTPTLLIVGRWPPQAMGLPGGGASGQEACKEAATLEAKPLPGDNPPVASSAQFTPDGQNILTTGLSRDVKLWTASLDAEVKSLTVHTGKVTAVAFSQDGNFATVGQDGTFSVSPWKIEDLIAKGCTRVTRNLKASECKDFLGSEECPPSPCKTPGPVAHISASPAGGTLPH